MTSSTREQSDTRTGERHALLIANSQYLDVRLRQLRAPAEDARHLRELLLDPAIGYFDTATKIIDGSKSEIEEQIELLFAERKPDDFVLLYISGHGIRNDNGQLFFAACNTRLSLPRSTAIAGSFVQSLLDECQAGAKLVLLDCCYSGAFTQGMVPKSAGTGDPLAQQVAGRGTCVITATDELEYAFEGEHRYFERPVHRSVFTTSVIKGLETGLADLDRDGVITGDELYRFVFQDVSGQGKQTPTRHNQLRGDFTIAKTRLAAVGLHHGGKPVPVKLDDVLPPAGGQPTRSGRTPLTTPVGRTAEPLGNAGIVQLDLTGQGGHIAVVGQLHSGKSTFLQTLVVGLSLTHSPQEAQFYCVDPGGQLTGLSGLPHVRTVLDPAESAPLRAMLERLNTVLAQRKRLFRQHRLSSADAFRTARGESTLPPGEHADVFLIVDGWEQATRWEPELVSTVHDLASDGLHFGLHVLVTARSWREIPEDLERLLLGKVELRLSDPAESRIDPEVAATLPKHSGYGLHEGGRFIVARPDVDGVGNDLDAVIDSVGSDDDAEADDGWLPELRTETLVRQHPALDNPSLLELLGLPRNLIAFDVQRAWRSKPVEQRYRVPFGVDDSGQPVELDIKEAARGGMGPHGLCIGATGSGKSELLRTLVVGLMATNSSAALNFVLVDFKGGATFAGLERAPHTSAVITNLADDLALVDRMMDALNGELTRRQELLRDAGGFAGVWEYEQARESGARIDPLPALFIVVDEFSELLTAKPELVDAFVAVGRLGRSLRMHLLLASQRLEEGKLRGLDSHLSYRIGLRTFSAAESRAVLGTAEAYELPREPGFGYLRFDSGTMVRFRSACVSNPHPTDPRRSELDVIVDRLAGQGTPAHRVWLPPLSESPTLDGLLPNLNPTEDRGLSPVGFFGNGRLQVPLGIVDRPYEQRRDPLWADFSGGAGHGVVIGGPQSGKSTMLRTLVMSMALTHTPQEAQFYCIDLGGGTLAGLNGLPHVGMVATRREQEKVRRTVAELVTLVNEREARFGALGVDSMNDFRNRKRRGEITAEQDPFGDAFLVVDGWRALRDDFEDLEAQITSLAVRGLAYGVHVIIASNRWADFRPAIKDMLGTRFELRLGDPIESEIDRRAAAGVPHGRPGRGLTADKLHFLVALPRIDGSAEPATVGAGLAEAVTEAASHWDGSAAPKVRLLPRQLPRQELLALDRYPDGRLVPIGVNEDELAPVYLDFDAEPHFLAYADGESGKTNLLRQIVRGITERYSKKEAVLILVDYRRTMLGFVEGDQLLGYAVSANQLEGMIKEVAQSMAKRLPGPDVTPQQLKERSWWTGPELFVVVDDYDLVATSTSNPLRPLSEYLAQAKDVGLHVVVARRTGGAARTGMDPIIGKLKELATPGIVMNGSREEGALLGGVRPTSQPPGRGILVDRRSGGQLVQVALYPEE
ncbi:S-DNA-T family DNA segregation ATPase FtsK/SpoIIIE [Saccharomonospora amisosensis]|uniref:S-DNA-T family DNA segregation ATPase FtsK/SpoIIIE n=1 Tax=Saccharomonospora amisosensis TaxID=1128677 RepID=A0A7X5UR69_9PSEU|nr:type VII secretion protein EccCb [Saccharomonospora amisosensis]NIJ12709.1 S-DNA-T family DNA segregation ATPase FtsK/SpoIIIE [Saccharomonospora amisosensis]